MEPIDIVVAEDEYFTRQGICGLLADEPDCRVVGEAESGEAALQLVRELNPQILLLDLRMPPGLDGIEVIGQLRREEHPVRIIALTHEKRLIQQVEKAGGNGFIPKDKYQMFLPAVQCVARSNSNIFINPELTETYRRAKERLDDAELSQQELAVLHLMAYRNEEIARRVFKTPGRVRNMVTDIYFKLDLPQSEKVSQRIQAIQVARTLGMLEEPDP